MKKGVLTALAVIAVLTAFLFGVHFGRKSHGFPVTTPTHQDVPTVLPTAPEKLDINTATVEQLSAVPCIGRALAERIVAYRERYGAFHSLAELCNVDGIDPDLLELIRSYMCCKEDRI